MACATRRCRCRAPRAIGVGLHAHRVLLRAEHLHLRHPGNRGQALRELRFGVLVDGRQGSVGDDSAMIEDRRVGRIHLAERRRDRHVGGRLRSAPSDRRLHVLRGGVDVAVERRTAG
jgi:hypothetical protein